MRTILSILAAAALCLAQETTAEKLIEAGHWKRARAVVEQRLRQAPQSANANSLLSQIRAAFGDRTSPLELASKAVRLDGGVARYHRQLAEVHGVMAQHANLFQQAFLARRFRKEIDTALSLDPRDVQALRDLIEYYLMAPGILGGDTNKAEAVARQIEALDAVEGLLAGARIAEFRKDATRTEALLRRAAQLHPPSYKAQIALAWFYLAPEAPRRSGGRGAGQGRSGLGRRARRSLLRPGCKLCRSGELERAGGASVLGRASRPRRCRALLSRRGPSAHERPRAGAIRALPARLPGARSRRQPAHCRGGPLEARPGSARARSGSGSRAGVANGPATRSGIARRAGIEVVPHRQRGGCFE